MLEKRFVKYVFFITNFLFCLTGATLFVLGTMMLQQVQGVEILQQDAVCGTPSAIIVLGTLVALTSLFGYCGAIRESRCFLMMYSIITMLLAAGKIYLIQVMLEWFDRMQFLIENWIGAAFNTFEMRNAFFMMESAFRCCGTTGPSSYANKKEVGGPEFPLPWSCCAQPQPDDTCAPIDAFSGCNARIGGYFESFAGAIEGVIVTVIIIEVVTFVFACSLCHSIKKKSRVTTA